MEKETLDGAYALETPEDSVKLYAGWAENYDETFAAAHGYAYPRHIAEIFGGLGIDGPVLDIGAGTGLVAEHLSGIVDGIDISGEMLAAAAAKGLYRRRIEADLTGPLPIEDGHYVGFISAGTFTHGHVGPECLAELMRIARPGAVFCLGINARAFDGAGFGSAFAALVAGGTITPVSFRRIRVYAEGATHEHAEDTSLVAIFERL